MKSYLAVCLVSALGEVLQVYVGWIWSPESRILCDGPKLMDAEDVSRVFGMHQLY